ncbi:MAG: glycosyltransferase family 2 protein [Muribaculaceae bacterium]|nr:glycosyltransferase family 2 protein [Muribaculaceae bacterium]
MAKLQVLIAAYGPDALKRIADLRHPKVEDVEYLVSWQRHDDAPIPEEIASRDDFTVLRSSSVGLCNNRNHLLLNASADLLLISDDDIEYSTDDLTAVVQAFDTHPEAHFLSFKFRSECASKFYPDFIYSLSKAPKGTYVTSFELAFNRKKLLQDGTWPLLKFDPAFGINGTRFIAGEEDILVDSLLRNGLSGLFIPQYVCTHNHPTTAQRMDDPVRLTETKGAVMWHVKRRTRHLRMLAHAWRERKGLLGFFGFCRAWLRGERFERNALRNQ